MSGNRFTWGLLAPLILCSGLFSSGTLAQTLTVEGKGTVEIPPEFAHLGASVSHTAETPAAAQAVARASRARPAAPRRGATRDLARGGCFRAARQQRRRPMSLHVP